MARRPGPKSKKAAPKSRKVEKEPEPVSEHEEEDDQVVESAGEEVENNGNNEEDSEIEEPPSKKGRGRGRPPAKDKKTPAKKGRKVPAKKVAKKEESEEEEDEDDNKEYEVQTILEEKTKKNGEKEYLVKWKGYSKNENTWEPESNLNCPEAMEEFRRKQEKAKNENPKELRTDRKKVERLIDATTPSSGKRHSRRNAQTPRKTYRETQDSD